ncbi:MAG: hypothetical protein HYW85_06470 [Deltaproteobacteria bacterium]|nr:hypothetical protein [Deltaproteobacteria bacterium]
MQDISDKEKGAWLPLLEYAVTKGMSLSTLRRRIKANKIQFQLREGKYFIYDDGSFPLEDPQKVISDLKEQVADLKTLVQVLESKQRA